MRRLPPDSTLENHYIDEGMSLTAIAQRYGVTKQAVHYHLVRAGVRMRPRAIKKEIVPEQLRSLLIDEGLSFKEASNRLGVSPEFLSDAAAAIGVHRRTYICRAIPALNNIKVGDELTFPRTKIIGQDYIRFYDKARKLGIKLSVESLDDSTIRVTRTQ